jgi:hypothetical protein
MLSAFASLFDNLISALSPEMALAGGIQLPPDKDEKPSLWTFKGGGQTPYIAPPPTAPAINFPAVPPPPPPPPPPPSASSADVAQAQQQGAVAAASGFGFNASLLKGGPGTAQGPTNTASGTGSLLGNR